MPSVPVNDETISAAGAALRAGELVAFPTETVYGLGANALDAQACARVFAAKERPTFDPLIVHVAVPAADDLASSLHAICSDVPEMARRLIAAFWPGPLTLVLPKSEIVPEIVTSGLPTVAVRMPSHRVAQALLQAAGVPIAAPSANRFGQLSPTTAHHVIEQLGDRVRWVIDGGPCAIGVESTIVDVSQDGPRLLRPGGLPLEEIERVVGSVALGPAVVDRPQAPGQLASHYAPRTPLVVLDAASPLPAGKLALLSLREPADRQRFAAVEVLSPGGDLIEAAANLFAALHRLDRCGASCIVARPVPETGLGRAIADRLRRAASSRD